MKKFKIILMIQFLSVLIILNACQHDTVQGIPENGGLSGATFWQQTSFDSTYITELAANPSGDIFAANLKFEVFRSKDNGESWTALKPELRKDRQEFIQVIGINSAGDIFAATFNGLNSRFLKSTDNGETWSQLSLPGSLDIRDIAFNSLGNLFIVSTGSDEAIPGIYRSTDNGQNWIKISFPVVSAYDIEIAANGYLYAATFQGIFRSTDDGDIWDRLNTGLADTVVTKLAIDGSGTIYASTDGGGIFRSSNQGLSWTLTSLDKPCINILFTDPIGDVFAGVGSIKCNEPEGIYFSTDKGANWSQLNEGLTDKSVTSYAVTSTGYLFVGTYSQGVFRSMNSTTQ